MTWHGETVLAVIPARGGSKGIPRKNLAVIAGLSLIARAARLATCIPWIDRVVISTDDDAMAEEAEAHGAAAPFRRPAELAGDMARVEDAWRHAWLECERIDDCGYHLSLLLDPTSPMRVAEDLDRTIEALTKSGFQAAATVSPMPAHFTPHKSLTLGEGSQIGFFHPEGHRFKTRQLIPPLFHRNGVCYAARRKTLVEERRIVEEECVGVIVDRPIVNIDSKIDIDFAEFLMTRQQAGVRT